MAQNRSSQRGVMRMARGMILAGVAALLSATGCSSEPTEPTESLGSSVQALTCSVPVGDVVTTVTCNTDDCTVFNCKGVNGGCSLVSQKKDGETCTTEDKAPGLCLTQGASKYPICCTGCIVDNRGVLSCVDKPTAKNCGIQGSACQACDKGDTCNVDICTAKGACDVQPVLNDQVACQDGAGIAGSCYNGSCCSGCIDGNDACQAGTTAAICGRTAGVVHAACKNCVDANKCDGTETCSNGVCGEQAGFSCPTDNNVCHAPTCDASMSCAQKPLTGNACPDANLCNGTETCQNGVCSGLGTPKDCDDKNPCTIDDCDPKTGACINTPQGGASCDDGNLCNGIGICNAIGACVVNPSPSCDDGEICTTDSCDPTPVTGGCKHANNTVVCTDADPCTTGDKCGGGKCVGGTQTKCDDGNACTADSCKAGVGCQFVPLTDTVCSDGNDCSTGDHCEAGACKATGGTICAVPNNSCKTSKCDGTTGGQCVVVNDDTAKCRTDLCHDFSQCSGGVCPAGEPVSCDDGNPCTTDGCEPATGCTHVADDAATCTDADLCTDTACKKGKCVAIDAQCDAFDDCHIAGTCNPKSGFCDSPPAPSGTECDSGSGKCDTKGKCIPNPPGGEGGAGGEGTAGVGAGGDGTAGSLTEGGAPPVAGTGGAGHEPTVGGEPSTEPTAGKAGSKATGGSATTEGGAPEEDVHVFVRDPGGCSCTVPQSPPSRLQWLGGLVLVGALARRRRTRLDTAAHNRRVS